MKPHESDDALSAGLRAVAEDDERNGASNAVGLRLLAEVQAIANARRRRTVLATLGAAAAVMVAVLVPVWRSFAPPPNAPQSLDRGSEKLGRDADLVRSAELPVVTRELVTEFFPLAYSNVPARGGYVVRMQVPRTALASFGATPFAGEHDSPNVLADVVVGDDGLARAVRFVQVINDDRQEQTP